MGIEGDLDGDFRLAALRPGALDPLLPALEGYPEPIRHRLTVQRPPDGREAIFLRPGEPVFDRLRALVCSRFRGEALRGAVFVDPTAGRPYFFHLALVSITRKADPALPALARLEVLEYRLVGLKQEEGGTIEECPVERLLLLRGGQGLPPSAGRIVGRAREARELATTYLVERIAGPLAEQRRAAFLEALPAREAFLARGYDSQEGEFAALRVTLTERTRAGDSRAAADLTLLKERQRALAARRDDAQAAVRREPELIAPEEVTFLAHALVVPSTDPEDRRRHDAEVEAIAVKVTVAYGEVHSASVTDVSTPDRALAAGLTPHPGFDLVSRRPSGEERAIEVKGRAGVGDVEMTENEWAKACNLRDRYWLYVVFDCAGSHPRLFRVRDPFYTLIAKARGGVIVDETQILAATEAD
jgi:hypothetical protein